ncbi:serpin family protein [Kitasatospora sp. NPDC054939]
MTHPHRRRPAALLLAAALAAPLLTGCGATDARREAVVLVRAAAPATPPTADPARLTATADATTAFGLDLYRALAAAPGGKDRNLVLSPTGLSTVLAMLLPGAKGATAEELARALHTDLAPADYAHATGALNRSTTAGAKGRLVLRQTDNLYVRQGLDLAPGYLDTLAGAFDTGVRTTDFAKDPDAARKAVNQQVEKDTEGRIKELLGAGTVTPTTQLILTDALYLKGEWAAKFKKADTADRPFHRLDGTTANVSSMQRTGRLRYAEGTGGILGRPWAAVELPYADSTLAMDLIVPAQGGFDAFVRALDGAQLDGILDTLAERKVDLTVPRFRFETGGSLVPALRALGVNAAFDAADLSGIPAPGSKQPIKVGDVVQRATVEVDEEGTVAAAGSAVVGEAGAAPAVQDPVRLRIDRPFVFLIRDTATGRPLFLGQVTDPAAH